MRRGRDGRRTGSFGRVVADLVIDLPVVDPALVALDVVGNSTGAAGGFDLAPAEVTLADGEVCALCLWVAASSEQHQRGLMGVTDLGPADGMVFVYGVPSNGSFWMRGTPMPLSIAFFAEDGGFVSATDMGPCLTGPPEDCLLYSAGGPYFSAIEVPQGRLDELGIGPGSRLAMDTGSGCDAAGP